MHTDVGGDVVHDNSIWYEPISNFSEYTKHAITKHVFSNSNSSDLALWGVRFASRSGRRLSSNVYRFSSDHPGKLRAAHTNYTPNGPLHTFTIHYTLLYNQTHSNILTPWRRIFPEKLTGPQLVKKFPRFSGNPKIQYRIHKRPPSVPILSQINPVHALILFLEDSFWQYPPSTPRSFKYSFSLRSPHLSSATRPAHVIVIHFVNQIIFGEEYTSCLLGPNIFLSTLLSNSLIQCSSLNVTDQVSHPHKTAG
jgi:hypothetical protein